MISITVPSTSKETQPSGSGGGGGGRGDIDTGEEYENIELKEIATVYVSSGSNVSYQFENPGNPVIYVIIPHLAVLAPSLPLSRS